ncbi:MAG: hypothetical protein GY718_04570 [Lentisphaerae bacterium]|nr:hypothetical protein [Lentisphaerota bacterium]
MSGYSYCKWCHGRGCLACDGERKKHEAEKTELLKNWRPPSDEDVSLAKNLLRQLQETSSGIDMSDEELEARIRMPEPIATIKTDNEGDMELAKSLIGLKALQSIAEETGGDPQAFNEQLLKNAEEFRIKQGKLNERRDAK